jgi:hypothetical protein
MRKGALSIVGALLIAGSAVQMASASVHHIRKGLTMQMATAAALNVRKVARAPVPVAQQLRDAFGSVDWPSTALSDYSNYNRRHGLSAPAAVDNKSCDRLWCYEN